MLAPNASGSDQIRLRRDRMQEALQHTQPDYWRIHFVENL